MTDQDLEMGRRLQRVCELIDEERLRFALELKRWYRGITDEDVHQAWCRDCWGHELYSEVREARPGPWLKPKNPA
jgi:hypothetical protein